MTAPNLYAFLRDPEWIERYRKQRFDSSVRIINAAQTRRQAFARYHRLKRNMRSDIDRCRLENALIARLAEISPQNTSNG